MDALDNLYINLQKFENKIEKERLRPGNHSSADNKLERLIQEIHKKRHSGENNNNPKVVVFTVYRDTAQYLLSQFKSRGFSKLAMVSGTGSLTSESDEQTKNFEPILERFAPYTKLFMEKQWDFHSSKPGIRGYYEWIEW